MAETRGLTVYFIDGSKMKLDFPRQASDEVAAIKLKEILAAGHLIAEVDGVMIMVPFNNIKYIESHPAPAKLPSHAIKAATVSSS